MRLIYNSDAKRLQKDFDDNTPITVAEMFRSERTGSVPLELFLVDNDGGYATPGTSDYEVVIGRQAQELTTGKLKLTFTGTTEEIDLSKPKLATRIEAALNAVSEINSAGGVDVIELNNGRAYQITFRSNGSRAAITAGVSDSMQPASALISEVTAGTGSSREIQLLTLEEASLAEVGTNAWSANSNPALAISTLVEGTANTREVSQLSISGDPAPGSFFVVSNSEPIPTEATAAQVKSILNSALSSDIGSVKKTGERIWQITYKTNGDKTALSAGTHNLVKRPSVTGTLSLNTTALAYAANSDGSDLSIGFTLRKSNEVVLSEKINLSEPFAEVLGSSAMLNNDSIGALFSISSNDVGKGKAIALSGGLTYDGTTLNAPHLQLTGGTMSGAVAMGSQKITGLADGTASGDAINKGQLDGLIDNAPAALNTLNELAAALGDDVNFSTTVSNNIATKLPLAGGTLTGDVLLNDGVKAKFGTHSDLTIQHDGNSYISENGTGDFYITTNNASIFLQDAGSGSIMLAAKGGSGEKIELNHSGSKKFETLSTGVKAYGLLETNSGGADSPSLKVAYDANNYLEFAHNRINGVSSGSHHIAFQTGGNEAARFDSSGDLTMKGGRIILRESDDGNDALKLTRDADEGYVQLFSSGSQTVELRGNGDSYFNGGNLVIGATTAQSKFHVSGGDIRLDNAKSLLGETNGGGNFQMVKIDTSDNMLIGDGNFVIDITGSSELMRLNSTGLGIGVTPSAFLHVSKDNDNSGNQFCVADTEGATAAIRTYATSEPQGLIINHYYAEGGSGNEYARYADFVSNVGSGAATKMRFITKNAANTYSTTIIDNEGRLGIGGVTSPSDALTIGNASNTKTASIKIDSTSFADASVSFSHNGTYGFTIGTDESDSKKFKISSGDTLGTNDRLVIDGSTGNVGIGGVTSPSANLDIYNGSGWAELHLDGSSGGELKLQKAGTTHLDLYASDSGSTGSVIKAQSNLLISSNNTTDANRSIYLNSSGNVGISTTAPSHLLSLGTSDNATGKKFSMFLGNTGTYSAIGAQRGETNLFCSSEIRFINEDNSSGTGAISLATGTNSLTEKMRIASDGNVGIGTTAPLNTFQISEYSGSNGTQSISGTASIFANSGDDVLYLGLKNGSYQNRGYSFQTIQNGVNADFVIKEHGLTGERIRLASSGNVGIGTDSPSAKLEIAGNTDEDSNFLIIRDKDPSSGSARPSVRFAKEDGTILGQLLALDGANQRLQFSGNNTEDNHLTVYNNGNIGISVTDPSAKLEISDSASANIRLSTTDTDIAESQELGALEYYQADNSGTVGAGVKASMRAIADNATAAQTALTFGTSDSSNNDKLRLKISGDGDITQNYINYTDGSNYEALKISAESDHIKFNTSSIGSFASNNRSIKFHVGDDKMLTIDSNGIWSEGNVYVNSTGSVRNASDHLNLSTSSQTNNDIIFKPNNTEAVRIFASTLRIHSAEDKAWTVGDKIASLEFFSADQSGSGPNSVRSEINLVTENTFGSAHSLSFATRADVSGSPTEKAKITSSGDMELVTDDKGLILSSANGTRYRITCANDGTVTSTAV